MIIKLSLHHWPIFTALWLFLGFAVSYTIAIAKNHVYYLFPYISDTGSLKPESSFFGFFLNLGAFFMLGTQYIRFRVVCRLTHHGPDKSYNCWNKWSNLFGCLSCLGMSLVANFQESSIISVHIFGAFLAFFLGTIYCLIHAYLTWLSHSSKWLKCARICLSAAMIPMYITSSVAGVISMNQFDGRSMLNWSDNNAGYEMHLVATFSEWLIGILLIVFTATFCVEFQLFEFEEISFVQKQRF